MLFRSPTDRQQIAPLRVRAVGRDRIDLGARIRPPEEGVATTPRRTAPDGDDISTPPCPLTLDAKEAGAQVDGEVVAHPFRERLQDADPEQDGRVNDC